MKRKDDDLDNLVNGCAAAFGCVWLVYAALIISIVAAVSVILWRIAFG